MKKSKIAIFSVPRSGSSWVGEIINSSPFVNYSYQPLFSYAFKSRLSEHSSLEDIDLFFSDIEKTEDTFVRQTQERESGGKPFFKKLQQTVLAYKEVRYINIIKNLLEKDVEIKIIGLVRNPVSVLSSWKRAPREFRQDLGWDFEREWRYASLKNEGKREEYFGYEKWKESTLLFEELNSLYPNQFMIIKYNDLITDLDGTVSSLFKFLDLTVTEQTLSFLRVTSKKGNSGTYSVYNGKAEDVTSWQSLLPKNIVDEVVSDCISVKLDKYLK